MSKDFISARIGVESQNGILQLAVIDRNFHKISLINKNLINVVVNIKGFTTKGNGGTGCILIG